MTPQTARITALVAAIERIGTQGELDALTARLASPGRTVVLGFVNAHAVNLCWADATAAADFAAADVLLRDGKGMELLDRAMGRAPGLNLCGTDLIPRLLGAFRGRRVAVFGTREPWLAAACRQIGQMGLTIVATRDGYAPRQAYLDDVGRTAPDIVILAMGMPRQEALARAIRDMDPRGPCLVVCGGAIADFLGGRHPRAPHWMRRTGFEWLYRLWREPVRLFRRYAIGNLLFLWRAWVISTGSDRA